MTLFEFAKIFLCSVHQVARKCFRAVAERTINRDQPFLKAVKAVLGTLESVKGGGGSKTAFEFVALLGLPKHQATRLE